MPMNEPTEDDIEKIVHQAQQLDGWKQAILAEMRARGEDTDGARLIISHRTDDGGYTATEVMTPRWMKEPPPATGEPDA